MYSFESRPSFAFVITASALFLLGGVQPEIASADSARCKAGKLKAASTYSRCLLKLNARAAASEQPVDSGKVATCAAKLVTSWQKAEARSAGECSTNGDLQVTRDWLDCIAANLSTALDGPHGLLSCNLAPTPSTTTTTSTTTTSTGPGECVNTGDIMQTSTTTTTVIERCMNGIFDGPETDLDCGGDCGGCSVGEDCLVGFDCFTRVCDAGKCAAPTCSDGVRNGFEVAPDCGGGGCPGCDPGGFCIDCSGCASQHCDANWCQ